MTVREMRDRLLAEHPGWSNDHAWDAAVMLTALAEQMQFEMDVEADLDQLPMVAE